MSDLPRIAKRSEQQRKRELRLQIGRMRRRINNRIHATARETRRLGSWRTYVQSYPTYGLAAAFGVGLAASAGRRSRRVGLRIVQKALTGFGRRAWTELKQLWADSAPQKSPADEQENR
jgi:hypothetical protein